MKNPTTSFNVWLLTKILGFLSAKEGCTTEESVYTASGIKAVVRDVFGYRYEIHIKTLSRTVDHMEINSAKFHNVSFSEPTKTFNE